MRSARVMRLALIKITVLAFAFIGIYPATARVSLLESGGELAGVMVSIPAGSFDMGDLSGEVNDDEKPVHIVTADVGVIKGSLRKADTEKFESDHEYRLALRYKVPRRKAETEKPVRSVTVPAFKLGKYEVTFAQWDACVVDGGCKGYSPDGVYSFGRGNLPVTEVSWDDVQSFIGWVNEKTGGNYRLPTEAEWEYAARAGSTTKYSWGNDIGINRAKCDGCAHSFSYSVPVGSFPANAWGLHDMHGNMSEWVQDCWNDNYVGAPKHSRAWTRGDCSKRVIRGGSWYSLPEDLRSSFRNWYDRTYRVNLVGFRLAQDEQDEGVISDL